MNNKIKIDDFDLREWIIEKYPAQDQMYVYFSFLKQKKLSRYDCDCFVVSLRKLTHEDLETIVNKQNIKYFTIREIYDIMNDQYMESTRRDTKFRAINLKRNLDINFEILEQS